MPSRADKQREVTALVLDYIALGLLVPGPNYGYELYHEVTQNFGAVCEVGRSRFYAALAALHDRGYLDLSTEPQEDRPPRKMYRLTDAGREVFNRWLAEPVMPPRLIRVVLLVKLRFFDLLGLPGLGQLIDAQIASCRERRAREDAREVAAADRPDHVFYELVVEFRRKQLDFIIDWLHTCRSRLLKEP